MGFNSAFKGLKRTNRTVFIILFRRNGVVLFITWQGREILLPLSLNIKQLINVLKSNARFALDISHIFRPVILLVAGAVFETLCFV
jgi:E3 ubiquitin-protein ligase DOA10